LISAGALAASASYTLPDFTAEGSGGGAVAGFDPAWAIPGAAQGVSWSISNHVISGGDFHVLDLYLASAAWTLNPVYLGFRHRSLDKRGSL
jgi:hypothetical protein